MYCKYFDYDEESTTRNSLTESRGGWDHGIETGRKNTSESAEESRFRQLEPRVHRVKM